MAIQPLRRSRHDTDFSKKHEKKEGNEPRGSSLTRRSRRRRAGSMTRKNSLEDSLRSSEHSSTPFNMEEASFAESSLVTIDWNPFDDEKDGWAVGPPSVTSEMASSSSSGAASPQKASTLRKAFKNSPLVRSSTRKSSQKKTNKDPDLDLSSRSGGRLARRKQQERLNNSNPRVLRRNASSASIGRRKERNSVALRHSRSSESSSLSTGRGSTSSEKTTKNNSGALSSFLEQGGLPGRRRSSFAMGPKEQKDKGYIKSFLGSSQEFDDVKKDEEDDQKTHVSLLSKGLSALEKMYGDINNI